MEAGDHTLWSPPFSLQDQLVENKKNGYPSVVITIAQSMAFILINGDLLLSKLHLYGFDLAAMYWFKSYLSTCTQLVEIQGVSSHTRVHSPCTMVQGSLGSCILYNVFTADLPQALHSLKHSNPQEENTVSRPLY